MKITIPIVDDLKLTPATVFDRAQYSKDGYYLVNDGTTNNIASVAGDIITFLPISSELVLNNSPFILDVEYRLNTLLEDLSEVTSQLSEPSSSDDKEVSHNNLLTQDFVLDLLRVVKPKGK